MTALCTLIGLGALLIIYMFLEAKQNRVKHFNVPLQGLPASFNHFRLYFVSDIHRRKLSSKMLEKVMAPDLIVIGGDLMEKGVPFQRVKRNLEKLCQFSCPILFIWGNHDLQVDPIKLRRVLKEHGIIILTNAVYTMSKDQQVVNFIGVHDATNALDGLDLALLKVKEGIRILLSHNPIITEKLTPDSQIPLVLSGHTHGGQIRIFGWGIREKGGVKSMDFGTLIISNGYGTTRYPLRLGAPPDTLLIQLQQVEKD
jgi:predicted MPP superfamily phosphohydrolase